MALTPGHAVFYSQSVRDERRLIASGTPLTFWNFARFSTWTQLIAGQSGHVHSTIDMDGLAGDVTGPFRGEKDHRRGYIRRISEASQGDAG